jgi:hypothetical protein
VIVNDRLATVMVAFRDEPEVFAATLYVTLPLPVPLPLALTHDADVDAVQLHPLLAVTANDPEVPCGPTDTSVGASEYEHCLPAWLRTSDRPPTCSVARRPRLSGFELTATCTVPGPEPDPPDGNDAHDTGLDELHGQPPCVVTATGMLVASAPTFTRLGEMV